MSEVPFNVALMRERARFQFTRKQVVGLAFGRGGDPNLVSLLQRWERGEATPNEDQAKALVEVLPRLIWSPPRWAWMSERASSAAIDRRMAQYRRDNLARVKAMEPARPPPVTFAVGLDVTATEEGLRPQEIAEFVGVTALDVTSWMDGGLVLLDDAQFTKLWELLPCLRAGIDVGAVRNPPYALRDKDMQMIQPVTDRDARRQLGDLIKRARAARGMAHRELAERCGVDVETFKAWEDGERVPRGRQWARLKGSLYALQPAALVWRAAIEIEENEAWASLPVSVPAGQHDTVTVAREEEEERREEQKLAEAAPADTQPTVVEPPPPLQVPARQTSFGDALRVARVNAGFTQAEMGELIGVGGGAISNWENEQTTPVLENWMKLTDLVPEMKDVAPPGVQYRAKPVGNRAYPRAPTVDPTAPKVATPMPPADSAPVRATPVPTPDAALAPVALRYARAVKALRRAEAEVGRCTAALAAAQDARDLAKLEEKEAEEALLRAVDE